MVLYFAIVVGDFYIFLNCKTKNEDPTAAKFDCVAPGDNSENVKYLSFLKP